MTATLEKYPGETAKFDFNVTDNLADDETISSVSTVAATPTLSGAAALTFGTPTVNVAAIEYSDGRTGKIGGVIQVTIGAGAAASNTEPRVYSVLATFATSAGNTLQALGYLRVKAAV